MRIDEQGNEAHSLHDFTIYQEIGSRFVRGVVGKKAIGIRCPRCSATLPLLEHGKHQKCYHCKLNMQALGNDLILWEGRF